jgi:hypothetical protein
MTETAIDDYFEPCNGCLKPVVKFANPCMDCCHARAKAAFTHRCTCGRKRRENPEIHKIGGRTWKTCDRCLASTGQLS